MALGDLVPLVHFWHLTGFVGCFSTDRTRTHFVSNHWVVGGASAPELPFFDDETDVDHSECQQEERKDDEKYFQEFHFGKCFYGKQRPLG